MKKILFIITGSIAANKCLDIFDLLNSNKISISCILTDEAKKYIKISKIKKYAENRVFIDNSENKNKMLHINLSRKNDLVVVCPASANSISKFANGYGDNLASNTLLASNKKIFFVPAMNSQMWFNKANQKNIKIIKDRGHQFIGPEIGKLKCGEYGIGRISNLKNIQHILIKNLQSNNYFKNKNCLVTAGPTCEMIDAVRYISNQSSGKQGYEIAQQLALHGANVTLVSGPTNLDPPPNVKFIGVNTAEEMYKKIYKTHNIDIGVFTAAVSDFKNKKIINTKIKENNSLKLNLVRNIDILEKIGNNKNKRPKFLVGFSLETNGVDNARKKLIKKNCDMIVYNKISSDNKIFGSDYNKISIITKNEIKDFSKMTKARCAKNIIKYIYRLNIIDE